MPLRTRTTTSLPLLVALAAAVPLTVGCMGESQNKAAGDKKAGDKKADKKAGDKKAGDKKAGDKKAGDKKAGDKKADKKDDAKTARKKPTKVDPKPSAEGEKGGRSFRKGQVAPRGMTPEEVRSYAEAQGDPRKGVFSLEDAFKGDDALADKTKGKLHVTFHTTMGEFECELFEDKAPKTVANFVGLGRGVRESYDKEGDSWTAKAFYDGIVFHRVIKGFMIQTGDPTGSGTGGPGYVVEDEFGEGLKHTGPGNLSMANRGPNTGSSQFFVTVAKTPHLDGKHAIFGRCEDASTPIKISEVKVDPRRNHRPFEAVKIEKLSFARK